MIVGIKRIKVQEGSNLNESMVKTETLMCAMGELNEETADINSTHTRTHN